MDTKSAAFLESLKHFFTGIPQALADVLGSVYRKIRGHCC